jgi:N-acetylglutamate synthase-like GNAT family acetyltransferase
MKPSIAYSVSGELSAEELGPLLRSTDTGDYSREKLQGIISRSTAYVTARDAGALVGFGRLLSDRCTVAFINNMAVDPGYQRQGIGHRILDLLLEASGDVNAIYLYTSTADTLYLRIGFEQSEKRLYVLRKADKE